MKTRFVLSIDGGGVRGLVAAVFLDVLEGEVRKAGYQGPLSDCFDVIAGTSTGAIIAAGLAAPARDTDGAARGERTGGASGAGTIAKTTRTRPLLSPSELRDLYRRKSRRIFPARALPFIPVLGAIRQLFGPLYSPKPLARILDDMFEDRDFINPRRNLLITAYSLDPRDVVFFRGGPHTPPGDPLCTGTIRLADAVLGAASAPTFFPPHVVINRRTGRRRTMIDGAVFINDPAVAGFAEALRLFPDDDVRVVSIGTGRIVEPISFETARRWGFFGWINPGGRIRTPLLSTIFDGQARAVHSHMTKLLGDRYQRFDYDLARGYGAPVIDDSSPANIRALETGALKMAEDMRPQLASLGRLLAENRARRDAQQAPPPA
ncbi:MAG: patatin-like phospholipase family protein [Pseudomonadota bacterium]